ncbi:hypothetical protein ACI48J_00450 [Paenibacillus chitinolyticus]|uniref:hypothetical protein n=1 Tax=Paenibacillus chitinolyticus TaxID=79263 RepID=UPI002DB9B7A0|nr:hypothetical protein [Paenibacillus chitinolyticus]MEC0245240.1 hypothetical protein [Paenibacillus chitinolyticus]
MSEELLKKLRYKEGPAFVLNAPEGYRLGIETVTAGQEDKAAFLQLFVNHGQEVDEWVPKAIPMLREDAVFWITYPKQSSKVKTDINRDTLAAKVQNNTEYRPVSNVAVDDMWSALRFRRSDLVKSKK